MKDQKEYWMFVPGTEKRFAVSNLGHLMKVARKRRCARKIILEGCLEVMPLISDYKTNALGWYVWFDGANHFYARDELMKLFGEEVLAVDHSMDQSAIERREASFKDGIGVRDDV